MADLTDVEQALVAVIAAALYPSGGSGASITGDTVNIAPGWPISAQLDNDIAAGAVNVSVFPVPGMGKNTTRYPRDTQVATAPVHTVTATVSGNKVTIGGTISTPQNVIVLCGANNAFAYGVQSADTLNSIAAALAALIAAVFPGTSAAGAVVTIVGKPGIVQARIAGVGTTWTEERRQQLGFDVSVWASSPTQRTNVAKVIDLAFAEIDWLTLSDQSAARCLFEGSTDIDQAEKVTIYRRAFRFTVEYPTVLTGTAYEVGTVGLTETGGVNSAGQPATTYS